MASCESDDGEKLPQDLPSELGSAQSLAASVEQDLRALKDILDYQLQLELSPSVPLRMAKTTAERALKLASRLIAVVGKKPGTG